MTQPAALAAVSRLRRLAAEAPAGEDASWLAGALQRYLAGAPAGLTLEQALGLATPAGVTPWWRSETLAARDALLRALAKGFTGPGTARASQLAHLLRRYAGASWPHDRRHGQATVPGEQRRQLFQLFSLDPDPPLSVRRLYDILAAPDAVGSPFSLHDKSPILAKVTASDGDAHGLS